MGSKTAPLKSGAEILLHIFWQKSRVIKKKKWHDTDYQYKRKYFKI
jgi:hypothetical protein